MELKELFLGIISDCETLPAEIRLHASNTQAIEQSHFDESYIDFLDSQIQLSPRGPEWTARLRKRRDALQPYCGVELLQGVVRIGNKRICVYAHPSLRLIVHWEEYEGCYSP